MTPKTLREWEKTGQIKSERTAGGHRRYEVSSLLGNKNASTLTVAYARVSSNDQKEDLRVPMKIFSSKKFSWVPFTTSKDSFRSLLR